MDQHNIQLSSCALDCTSRIYTYTQYPPITMSTLTWSTHHIVHPSHGPPITLFTQHIVNHHMVYPSPSHCPPITSSTHHIVHQTHSPPINLTEVKNYECFRSFPQVGVPPPLYTIACVNFDKVLHNTGRGSSRPKNKR